MFIVLIQKIKIKEEKIEVVKTWPQPKVIRDIQIFLSFTNFYWQFIKSFNNLVTSLILILKTILSTFLLINGSTRTINPNAGKVFKEKSDVRGNTNGKVKNLSKFKNIKNLTKSKKVKFCKDQS